METVQQAIIVNEKEQFLVIQNRQKKWMFPIDELREDEKFEASLKEAVKSATGLDIDIMYQFFSSMINTASGEKFNVAYLCRMRTKNIKLSADFVAHRWVRPNELKKLQLTSQQVAEMAEKAKLLLGGGGESE
jgi:hypothetical protein